MITYVSICSSELDEDVGDCDGNFVKRPFSSNKTAVAALKKKSKRALDLRNAKNSAGSAADTIDNVRRTRSRKAQT
uniref:Uncharacterized protein n=1 Tax=Aegilops tauschii subsp. strangulata TaxID=200361 RepID=A0A453G0V5_AEGTS